MDEISLAYELRSCFPNLSVLENEPMRAHCSFRIGGPAAVFTEPEFEMELAALRRFKPFHAVLTLDNGEVIDRSFTIISLANGRYFGGGMKVAPLADPHDGLLDVMLINGLNKLAVPFLLPFFITGTHIKLPICRRVLCREVRLSRPGMTFNMDGELHQMDEADVQILPGHLTIHLPAASIKNSVRKMA